MGRNIQYKKLKYILNKFFQGFSSKDKIVNKEEGITENNVAESITILKKFDILYKSDIQGENNINSTLVDNSIFANSEYNQIAIAAITHTQDEYAKDTIKYIFKDTKENIIKSTVLKYQKRFDASLLSLIDSEKYQLLLRIIEDNKKEANKLMYKFVFKDLSKNDLVPIDLVILDDSWFLFSYNTISQKYQFDNSIDIVSLQYLNDIPKLFLQKEIEEEIDDFLDNKSIYEIEVKLTAEILNSLIKLNLIEDYSILKEIDKENKMSLYISKEYRKFNNISKVNYNTNLKREIHFANSNVISKFYVVKLKIKKINLKILIQLYPQIFEKNKTNSNLVKYCKCCNKPLNIFD